MRSFMSFDPDTSGADRAAQTRALKEAVRTQFGLGEDTSVFVAEVTCGEAECPDVETVIATFVAGHRREFRVHKPVASITEQDIAKLDCRALRQPK